MRNLEANNVYRNRPSDSWVVINHETGLVVRTLRASKRFPRFADTMPPGYSCMRVWVAQREGRIPAADDVMA